MNGRTLVTVLALAVAFGWPPSGVRGAVVIIANRTQSALRFETLPDAEVKSSRRRASAPAIGGDGLSIDLSPADGRRWRAHTLEPGDLVSVPLGGASTLGVRGRFGSYELRPYGVYYVGASRDGKAELHEIGLAKMPAAENPRNVVAAEAEIRASATENDRARRTITVALYVDDDERAAEHVWQRRLADRIDEASKILERTCGMKLAVKSFGAWKSDDAVNEFELSLREFERKVRPDGGVLAIGFTSQYELTVGRTHLGGTRGPLHTHILLREWSQHVSETERLELLVHELGHYLGASHSPERNSVMRPILGDRQARAKAFRIAPDPVNALAMSVVGEEIRERGIKSFAQLSQPARARLAAIYTTLAEAMPKDPAAAAYLQSIERLERSP
jgi:hypothetical protein